MTKEELREYGVDAPLSINLDGDGKLLSMIQRWNGLSDNKVVECLKYYVESKEREARVAEARLWLEKTEWISSNVKMLDWADERIKELEKE